MPNHALQHVAVDYAVGITEMIGLLVSLTQDPAIVQAETPMSKSMEIENRIAMEDDALEAGVLGLGPISPYTCPECHGVLVQLRESRPTRFRCHTGHAFSMDGLLAAVDESIEETLWGTIRVLDERVLLQQQMEEHARAGQDDHMVARILQKLHVAKHHSQRLRQVALSGEIVNSEGVGGERADE